MSNFFRKVRRRQELKQRVEEYGGRSLKSKKVVKKNQKKEKEKNKETTETK